MNRPPRPCKSSISAAVASGLGKRSALSRRSEASGWRLAFDVLISANSLSVPRPALFAARWCLLFDHLGNCTVATISLKVGSNFAEAGTRGCQGYVPDGRRPGPGKVLFGGVAQNACPMLKNRRPTDSPG